MKTFSIQSLPLEAIRQDPELQQRPFIDPAWPVEYREQIEAGAEFPPVVIFRDEDGVNWLADGNLRLEAHRLAGRPTIDAFVYSGGRRDALLYSLQANRENGKPVVGDGAKKAVLRLLADPEWSQWSNGVIARRCKVNEISVRRWRDEVKKSSSTCVEDTEVPKPQRVETNKFTSNSPTQEGEEVKQKPAMPRLSPPSPAKVKCERAGKPMEMNTAKIGKKPKEARQKPGPKPKMATSHEKAAHYLSQLRVEDIETIRIIAEELNEIISSRRDECDG